MQAVTVVGLVLVLTGAVLVGSVAIFALGLLLLVIGRLRTRGPGDRMDLAIGATGLVLLLASAMQPMFFLIPSDQLLGGFVLACLSRLWRGRQLVTCLLLIPGSLVTITVLVALLWVGGALPRPHGPAELVFALGSLYGPVSAVALSVSWWLQQRRASR